MGREGSEGDKGTQTRYLFLEVKNTELSLEEECQPKKGKEKAILWGRGGGEDQLRNEKELGWIPRMQRYRTGHGGGEGGNRRGQGRKGPVRHSKEFVLRARIQDEVDWRWVNG